MSETTLGTLKKVKTDERNENLSPLRGLRVVETGKSGLGMHFSGGSVSSQLQMTYTFGYPHTFFLRLFPRNHPIQSVQCIFKKEAASTFDGFKERGAIIFQKRWVLSNVWLTVSS